jgi:hypothetical protein
MHSVSKFGESDHDAEAWAMFMSGALARGLPASKAAVEADLALREFRKRQPDRAQRPDTGCTHHRLTQDCFECNPSQVDPNE